MKDTHIKYITDRTRPFVALYRGVPVLMALFLAVTHSGDAVQGIAAQYPDGERLIALAPFGDHN